MGRTTLILPVFVLALALTVSANGLADGLKAKPIVVKDQWYDFTFHGSKVGFLYAKDEPTKINGTPAIHVHRWSVVTVRRKDEVIRMESTLDAWFDERGAPMRFKRFGREGGEVRSGEGYRDGKSFVVQLNVGGNLRTHRLPLKKDVYLSLSLESLFLHDLRVGKTLTGTAITEEDGQLLPFSMKVASKKKTPKGELFVVESKLGPIASVLLVRPNGVTVETDLPALGAKFMETTRDKALQVEAPVDIFSSALFKAPKDLPHGYRLEELTVRLHSKSGKKPTYIADERQRARKQARGVELRIAVDQAPKSPPSLPIKNSKMKKYLKDTPYEPLKDERLVATAQRVVKKSANAWEAAKRINRFVYDHIKTKNLARAFASANEALESKEGDCTEHAVLFSALAKITGIPTRLATGLVYVDGQNVFGYHEWVEVWMGSRWIAMDPTFGQDIADPTHIKFAQGQSDADGLREAGMVAASLIGDLELTVVGYTTDGGVKKRY